MQQEASVNQSSILSEQEELEHSEVIGEPQQTNEMVMIDTNYDMNFEPIQDVITPMNENEKSFISLPSSQF